jgi:hypothetical protein
MRRYIVMKDLPDIFDIKINYIFDDWSDEKTVYAENLNLTIDMSENKIETFLAKPDLSVPINSNWTAAYNIIVNKVSMSPLGNIIAFTEATANNDIGAAFRNFYLLDDKDNFYMHQNLYGHDPKEKTYPVEFFGDLPPDTQYLKLIPYINNFSASYGKIVNDVFEIDNLADNLPARFRYSEYGDIIIESFIFNDEEISVTYKIEGMAGDSIGLTFLNENNDLIHFFGLGLPIYDRSTGLYTQKSPNYVTTNPEFKNIKKFSVMYTDIELLEDQAIIIPLK